MNASEKNDDSRRPARSGPRTAPGGARLRLVADHDADAAAPGSPDGPPASSAAGSRTAVHAVRDAGGRLWTAARGHGAAVGGTAVGAAAAITGAYALGRRSVLRSRGPLTRLTGGRV
ncbi:hypothetical protein [Streptomyces sp. NPDC001744]|uniref:hypothetical protein n=1 Tax=Streptomyces sp. NPDC001744 TaxID=3364606 RepID=UPI003683B854